MTRRKADDDDSGTPPREDGAAAPAPVPGANDLMKTEEVLGYLAISRTKLWQLVNKEGLPAFKIGGDYRYRRSEIDAWIEKQRVQPDKPRDP